MKTLLKKITAVLLTASLAIGSLPFAASTAQAAATPTVTMAIVGGSNDCRYWHGSDPDSLGPGGNKSWGTGRGSYDGGTVKVENSGSTIHLKERDHFKNADFLLLPFNVSTSVPAYTTYTVTVKVDINMNRNSKGSSWFVLEWANNAGNAAFGTHFSTKDDLTMASGSLVRIKSGGAKTYAPSCEKVLTFANTTGAAKTVTLNYALFVGNSKSGSALNSYHHQLETYFTLTGKSVTAAKTITYNSNGGSSVSSQTYTADSTTIAAAPTKKGYVFTGWQGSDGKTYQAGATYSGNSGLALTAQWKEGTSTVKFNANGGSVSTASKTVQVDYTYGDLPTPTRQYYTFSGWYTAASGGSKVTGATTVTTTDDQTLYAHWQQKTATVKLDANGGSPTTSTTVLAGSTLSSLADKTATRTGYTFEGWYTAASGGTKVAAETNVGEGATYYAHWTANTYMVTFDPNYTDAATSTKDVTYDGTYGTLPTPERTNYTFTGWYTAASGGTRVQDTTKVTTAADHILYAHWTAKTYTVTFNAGDGGSVSPTSKTVTYDQPYGDLPVPTRSGYNFIGWNMRSDGAGTVITATSIMDYPGNYTLYAQWNEKHQHKVGPDGTTVEFTALTADTINSDTSAETYSLTAGNYYLSGDITTEKTILISGSVNLCLNGHTLTCKQIEMKSAYTLSICNCQGGGKIVGGTKGIQNYYPGGTINMYGGTITATTYGIYHIGTVNMYGGAVTGKYALYTYSGSSGDHTGTINVYGGILISSGTLTVDGATLTSSSGTTVSVSSGGKLILKSGSITCTNSSSNGVYLNGDSASIEMSGGTISCQGNFGLCVSSGSAAVSGGTIKGSRGIALTSNTAKLTLSGSPVITGSDQNVGGDIGVSGNATAEGLITVNGSLSGSYSVYRSAEGITETAPYALTSAAGADYSAHFTPVSGMTDIGVRDAVVDGQHVVQLYKKHLHDGVEYENYTVLTASDTDTTLTLTNGGHYLLTGDVTTNLTVAENTTVDLCLNGYTLTGKITVEGTLNLYDCQGTGTVAYTGNNAITVNSGGILNYYGGTLTDSDGVDVVVLSGACNLYAYPETKMIATHGSKLHIAEKLTKPAAENRCEIALYKEQIDAMNNGETFVFTDGWATMMGDADPADYFAPKSDSTNTRFVKVEKDDTGEAVLRMFRVTIDGEVFYPDYNTGTITPPETPTRTGYIWEGYYTAETGGDKRDITADTVFTDDLTLYSHWTECNHKNNTNTVTTVAATCTEPGSTSFTCSVCGLAVETVTPALGHKFGTAWSHEKGGETHYHVCTREGCGERDGETEAAHSWNDGAETTAPTIAAEGVTTYTCSVCGTTKTEAIPKLVSRTVSYETDAHTTRTIDAQTGVTENTVITLPKAGVTRTGYTLAGWALLDETGAPTLDEKGKEVVSTGQFTMPGRDVTFAVRWSQIASYPLAPGETMVLEDGTVIKNDSGTTVTIDQGGDGTVETTITLPDGSTTVTIQQGDNVNPDKIVVPPGTKVETTPAEGEQGPVITIGSGKVDGTGTQTGAVDATGIVDAPVGSTVTDTDGNTITITEGNGGRIDPDGVVTFPAGDGGTVTVKDKDGNTTTVTVPGGGEGVDVTPGGVPLVNNPDETLTIVDSDGGTTIVTGEDGTTTQTSASADGSVIGEVVVKPDTPAVTADHTALQAVAGETVETAKSVTVTLTVEKRDDPADKSAIDAAASAQAKNLTYLDMTLTKTIGGATPIPVTDTGSEVLEIVIPFNFTGKTNVTAYRKHGTEAAQALTKADTKADGTFRLDESNGKVYIYASKFSTYAIGYTAVTDNPDTPSGPTVTPADPTPGGSTSDDPTVKPDDPTPDDPTPSDPSSDDPTVTPEKPSQTTVSKAEQAKNALKLGAGLKVSPVGSGIRVQWGRVSGAAGYNVYVQYCGKNFTKKSLIRVKSGKTIRLTVKKINGKPLDLKKNYKIYVVAYKLINGKQTTLGKTVCAHIAGRKSAKYTNVKSIRLKKSAYTLKVGKTAAVKATAVLENKKKKQLSDAHAPEFRYASGNKKVATVTSKGKIKAIGKGSCTIYVYARNGCAKKIKVTVK